MTRIERGILHCDMLSYQLHVNSIPAPYQLRISSRIFYMELLRSWYGVIAYLRKRVPMA